MEQIDARWELMSDAIRALRSLGVSLETRERLSKLLDAAWTHERTLECDRLVRASTDKGAREMVARWIG